MACETFIVQSRTHATVLRQTRVLHGYLDTFGYLPFSSMHLMDTYRYSCLQILLSADTQLLAVSADRVLSADT